MPIGSGLKSSRHERALKKVHGKPSQAPTAVPMSSVPTSIDRSGVSSATASAILVRGLLRLDLAERVARVVSRADRARAVQERRARAEVNRFTPWRFHLADGHELIAETLERLHDRLELQFAPSVVGCHVSGNTPFGM